MYLIVAAIVVGCLLLLFGNKSKKTKLTYQEFYQQVVEFPERVKSVNVKPATGNNDMLYYVTGVYTTSTGKENNYYVYVSQNTFEDTIEPLLLSTSTITFEYGTVSNTNVLSVIINLLPLVGSIIIFILLFRALSSGGGNSKAFDFAKSNARLAKDKTVTFKDVAGCDEEKQELEEVVDFLKNPRKYVEIGARIPKGILLFGSPGTGKTLLAKAVAGEANVPFFSISGSDFVEMFVGVGASRVRDLFKTAKENSPCIVFIDEIDAVGRQRGAGLGGGHDEREQTLNQLLVEMDGFGNNSGIIVMAATNRPDILDPALLRPGRFDRQITVPNPDVVGREAILKVHGRNKLFAPNVHFNEVAQRIPGFSGAEIANLLNEAALLAARANRKVIELADIDEAVDRVLMGPAKKSRKYSDKERIMVAHHEAGHAVIGVKLENANIVQKVTIIPRGQAGGYALMLPEQETFFETKQGLLDKITGFLGGRVAEEICFNEISTGAHNDFQQATKIARAMVTQYGMSDMGTVQYENGGGNVFLGRDYLAEKNFSDAVAKEIDDQVRKIMDECYARAKKCITENKELLENIAKYLLEIETINNQDIMEIVETGHLKWWDDKKAADKAKNEKEEKKVTVDNQEVSIDEIKKAAEESIKKDDSDKPEVIEVEETPKAEETKEETTSSDEENKEE
ncbi:MAG: ATP-dependent zinc metalloprotease FtsH [Acholeplasmatales bacterium]|nr:ATP-dependent zinc metalloprotease FtsH [Acholeplasmatales bacterium]